MSPKDRAELQQLLEFQAITLRFIAGNEEYLEWNKSEKESCLLKSRKEALDREAEAINLYLYCLRTELEVYEKRIKELQTKDEK